jgi:hypothetical protein
MDSPTASPITRVECELEDDDEPDWDDSERGSGEELRLVGEWVERGREVLGVVVEWRGVVGRVAAVVVGWRVNEVEDDVVDWREAVVDAKVVVGVERALLVAGASVEEVVDGGEMERVEGAAWVGDGVGAGVDEAAGSWVADA